MIEGSTAVITGIVGDMYRLAANDNASPRTRLAP
jgi:hypothetical protein